MSGVNDDASATPSETESQSLKDSNKKSTGMDLVKKWEDLPKMGKIAVAGTGAVIPLVLLSITLGVTLGGSESSATNPCINGRELLVKPGGDYSFTREPESYKDYVDSLKEYLKPYLNQSGENVIDCNEVQPSGNQVCKFDMNLLGDCTPETNFGFLYGSPCFLLAFNMTPSCQPPSLYTQVTDLPKDIPLGLKAMIQNRKGADGKIPKRLWVYCTNADAHLPGAEYRDYYFKNTNVPGYLPPLVAVRFHAQQTKNRDIISECRVWAKDSEKRYGKVDLKVHMSD